MAGCHLLLFCPRVDRGHLLSSRSRVQSRAGSLNRRKLMRKIPPNEMELASWCVVKPKQLLNGFSTRAEISVWTNIQVCAYPRGNSSGAVLALPAAMADRRPGCLRRSRPSTAEAMRSCGSWSPGRSCPRSRPPRPCVFTAPPSQHRNATCPAQLVERERELVLPSGAKCSRIVFHREFCSTVYGDFMSSVAVHLLSLTTVQTDRHRFRHRLSFLKFFPVDLSRYLLPGCRRGV